MSLLDIAYGSCSSASPAPFFSGFQTRRRMRTCSWRRTRPTAERGNRARQLRTVEERAVRSRSRFRLRTVIETFADAAARSAPAGGSREGDASRPKGVPPLPRSTGGSDRLDVRLRRAGVVRDGGSKTDRASADCRPLGERGPRAECNKLNERAAQEQGPEPRDAFAGDRHDADPSSVTTERSARFCEVGCLSPIGMLDRPAHADRHRVAAGRRRAGLRSVPRHDSHAREKSALPRPVSEFRLPGRADGVTQSCDRRPRRVHVPRNVGHRGTVYGRRDGLE